MDFRFRLLAIALLIAFLPVSTIPAAPHQPASGIYKWIDSDGRTHFSDRATNSAAEEHSLKQLDYVEVSSDIKRKIAQDRAQQEKMNKMATLSPKVSRATRTIEFANYQFSNMSAGQKHGYVMLSGRISGGQRCNQLRIRASAKSDVGKQVTGSQVVDYAGFGSSLFEIKQKSNWQGGGRRPQWEMADVRAVCVRM